jgi:LPXTG-site transpeptidase (sortase) family protein
MPNPKKPPFLMGRPVATPIHFAPSIHWTDHTYIYRYDPVCRVCKRSPLRAGGESQYFAVTNRLGQEAPPEATPSPASPKRRWRLSALINPALTMVALAAAFLVVYPWIPEVTYRLHRVDPSIQVQAYAAVPAQRPIGDNRVFIPKIGVDTPILEGSSLAVLDRSEGVWHQTGNLQNGNFVLAGHRFRYLPPNTSTLYNLGKLAKGDVISVDWQGKRVVYQVSEQKTVGAGDIDILNPAGKPRLTIYTCTNMRETQRTVVVAEPLPAP